MFGHMDFTIWNWAGNLHVANLKYRKVMDNKKDHIKVALSLIKSRVNSLTSHY